MLSLKGREPGSHAGNGASSASPDKPTRCEAGPATRVTVADCDAPVEVVNVTETESPG